VACLFRTRSEAQRATKAGKVDVNGQRAKPHREVQPGDEIRITRSNGIRQVVSVISLTDRHLAKADARTLYTDRTPPPTKEEVEFLALLRHIGKGPSAATSPNKRERRQLRRLKRRG